MPRPKKLPGTAVDPRNGAKIVSLGKGTVERYDPPSGLCDAAVAAWEAFWCDRQAQLVTDSSKVVLERWIVHLDRYLRLTEQADSDPIVRGAAGGMVQNPLFLVADKARTVMENCEKQLGIGGLNAAALGLATIAEAKSLSDLNARYTSGGDDSDRGSEREDPRLRIING